MDSALLAAIRKNDTAMALALLDAGADPNWKDADGSTASLIAARNGHPNTVCLLKQAGAKE